MSGHSKWANIKNRKGAQDKKRSETFTRMAKNIVTAIRQGGGSTNIESNITLKTAIDKARAANMPKENVERLLRNFEEKKANLAGYMFEGYAPGGVPMMIEVETDNKNRTIGEIKNMVKVNGGTIGEEGCVAFMFEKLGEIETANLPEDRQLEVIDAGARDIEDNYVYVEPAQLKEVSDKLRALGLEVTAVQMIMKPKNPVELKTEEEAGRVVDLIEELEDNEDVVNVFTGFSYDA